MKSLSAFGIAICLSILTLFSSCTTVSQVVEFGDLPGTAPYYTSAFPVTDISSQLSSVQESIIRISSTGRYMVYRFDDVQVTDDQIEGADLGAISSRQNAIEESTSGSAIIIGKTQTRAYLITCAHTVEFPEQIVTYKKGEGIPVDTYIESVAVKQNQVNIAITPFGLVYYDLEDEYRERDLALLSINLDDFQEEHLQPLQIAFGSSGYLRTGSFIYVLGYPRGYETATQGMVSQANRNRNGDFITDALFNRGISGGLIIATKDNFRSFEWVGIANAGVAHHEYFLVPDTDRVDYTDKLQLYTGPVMAKEVATLNYGLTHAISTQSISEFLRRNRNTLRRLNSNLNAAFETN